MALRVLTYYPAPIYKLELYINFNSLLCIVFILLTYFSFAQTEENNYLYFDGDNSKILIPHNDLLNPEKEITIELKIKIPDSSFSNKPQILISNRGYNELEDFKNIDNWKIYDATNTSGQNDAKGFVGAVFDGRYIYFSPWWKGATQSGKILRYDTKQSYSDAKGWEVYDAEDLYGDGNLRGLEGAVFDGRFIYFVPLHQDMDYFSKVLRYDTKRDFDNPLSWTVYKINKGDAQGFTGAVFDGTYIYFIPNSFKPHLKAIRYNTHKDFHLPPSWEVFDMKLLPVSNMGGFFGGIFDGKYVYYSPFGCRSIIRYNTEFPFTKAGAWEYFDPHKSLLSDSIVANYSGVVFDGQYVYFSSETSGNILRYDTKEEFKNIKSWAVEKILDKGTPNNLSGGIGPVFDGRYIFFPPMHDAQTGGRSGRFVIYDTEKEFLDLNSWDYMDMAKYDTTLVGFEGGVFDGKNIYFSPMNFENSHGKILKYNTKSTLEGYSLSFNQNSSSFGSVLHSITFNIGTVNGLRNVTLDSMCKVNDDKWHFMTATYNGQKLMLYVDGVLRGSNTYSDDATILTNSGNLYIGGDTTSKNTFKGYIDGVRIWNKALSKDELFNDTRTNPITNKNLIACWKFEEEQGSNLYDSSPNHIHGKLVYGPTWISSIVMKPVLENTSEFICGDSAFLRWNSITLSDSFLLQLSFNKEFIGIDTQIVVKDSTILVKNLNPDDETYYWRVANYYNQKQSEWSSAGKFTILSSPRIVNQSKNITITEGVDFTLSLQVHSLDTVTYQWKYNNKNIEGATSCFYYIQNANQKQGGVYLCDYKNQCGLGDKMSGIYVIINKKKSPLWLPIRNLFRFGN